MPTTRKMELDTARGLSEYILSEAGPAVAKKIGHHRAVVHFQRDGGEERVELFKKQGQPAFLSYLKRPDGTIEARIHGEPETTMGASALTEQTKQTLMRWIRYETMTRAVRRFRNSGKVVRMMWPCTYGTDEMTNDPPKGREYTRPEDMVDDSLTLATQQTIAQMVSGAMLDVQRGNTRKIPADIDQAVEYAYLVISGEMMDPEVRQETQKLFYREHQKTWDTPSTTSYNTIAINWEPMRKMAETDAGIRSYYCQSLSVFHQEPQKLAHPGQIITQVKEDLGLRHAEWQVFKKLGPEKFGRGEDPAEYRQKVKYACRAIADANRPEASRDTIQNVADMHEQHQFYAEAEWSHGDPWTAWTALINRYLQNDEPRIYQIRNAEDALRGHIQDDIPWGPGTWKTLRERAERWHQTLQDKEAQWEKEEPPWDTLLGETKVDGITFIPVTNANKLISMGNEMNNCIGTYRTKCREGTVRVFYMRKKGRTTTALELVKNGDQWNLGQIENRGRRTPGEKTLKAAHKLAEAYTKASINPDGTSPEREDG